MDILSGLGHLIAVIFFVIKIFAWGVLIVFVGSVVLLFVAVIIKSWLDDL